MSIPFFLFFMCSCDSHPTRAPFLPLGSSVSPARALPARGFCFCVSTSQASLDICFLIVS